MYIIKVEIKVVQLIVFDYREQRIWFLCIVDYYWFFWKELIREAFEPFYCLQQLYVSNLGKSLSIFYIQFISIFLIFYAHLIAYMDCNLWWCLRFFSFLYFYIHIFCSFYFLFRQNHVFRLRCIFYFLLFIDTFALWIHLGHK